MGTTFLNIKTDHPPWMENTTSIFTGWSQSSPPLKVIFVVSMAGWWFFATPLKNDGVRQLGLLFPIYGKIKNGNQLPPIRWNWSKGSDLHRKPMFLQVFSMQTNRGFAGFNFPIQIYELPKNLCVFCLTDSSGSIESYFTMFHCPTN